MKCDELKSVYIDRTGDWARSGNDTGKFYLKEEVDAVIADLQKTNVMLADNAVKLNREIESLKKRSSCTFSDDCLRVRQLKRKLQDQCISCPVKMQEDDVVAELKQKIENVQANAYTESVDAGMRERRMKRALWLARAKRAEARKNYWYVRSIHEGDKNLWSIDGSAVKYIGCIKRVNFDWLKIWSEVECKCRAKAEEYR